MSHGTHGMQVLFGSETMDGTPAVVVQPSDFVFAVCHEGMNRSQVCLVLYAPHPRFNYVSPKPSTPVDTLDFLTLAGSKSLRFIGHTCLDPIFGVCR